MADSKSYIAVDLGAESGRVMLGTVVGKKLSLVECHRFSNGPVEEDGLRWDFARLMGEIKQGIGKAIKMNDGQVAGIAVDSWGVDFGLLDAQGQLLEKPFHYRDGRTNGMMEKAFEQMPRREIYAATGIQFMQFNTIFQLLSLRRERPDILKKTHKITFIADLVAYFLCGTLYGEYTLASTSQLMNMATGTWATEVFNRLGLPESIMPPLVKPGTVVGSLKPELAAEFNCPPIPVIAVGSHDTASAVSGVPAKTERWAYLSSGTWSLMGLEVPQPVINDATYESQFTNEGGVNNTIRLLKNIMGLWLVQECRRQWQREGTDLSYGELARMAHNAKPFVGFVDPDYQEFISPGEMPAKIGRYLAQTGQAVIADKGQLIRAILESLALKYRMVLEKLEAVAGHTIDVLHVVGGGIQNELLCQFTADAIGRNVIAGPVEATASGNILMQAMATGQLGSLQEARAMVANSYELKEYHPEKPELWLKQYQKVCK